MNIPLPENIEKIIGERNFVSDSMGLSASEVFISEDMVLKIGNDIAGDTETVKMTNWLSGKIPVPEIISHEIYDDKSYVLMSRICGRMVCDGYFLENPDELMKMLAQVFEMLWSVDISDCPRVRDIDAELREARFRVENDLVDIGNTEPDTFGKNGKFASPADLLDRLENNRPSYDPVLSHGDLCLPNIFIDSGKISGLIDLGDTGIGDRYRDIALCYRSLKHNSDGTFGGKIYKDLSPEMLLMRST